MLSNDSQALDDRQSQTPKVCKRMVISAEERNFQKECLEKHNEFRKQHGVPPLAYAENLSNIATSWARKLAASNQLAHSAKDEFGESVYMSEGIRVKGSTPVIAWYDEIEDYDFDRALFSANTGHFTQLVWKGTTHLGVGVAKTASGATVVVTNYHPRGNIRGQFRENVPPLRMAISKEGKEPDSAIGPILAGVVLATVCVLGSYYFFIL